MNLKYTVDYFLIFKTAYELGIFTAYNCIFQRHSQNGTLKEKLSRICAFFCRFVGFLHRDALKVQPKSASGAFVFQNRQRALRRVNIAHGFKKYFIFTIPLETKQTQRAIYKYMKEFFGAKNRPRLKSQAVMAPWHK